jgi:homocysteine S-methyltransferase
VASRGFHHGLLGSAAEWVTEAPRWRDLGAVAIGGCCRTGPDDIRRLRQVLEEAPATR